MAKLVWNTFINKHQSRVCLFVQFGDYAKAKAEAKKRKRPFLLPDGKKIPTPNQIMTKLAAKILKGDYALQGLKAGAIQQIMVTDQADVQSLQRHFKIPQFQPMNGLPCSHGASHTVDGKAHLAVSKMLGLL